MTIYTPESQIRQPGKLVGAMIGDLFAGRELAWRLAVRDISARYRQTTLGILWAFITPLATTLTWMFLNASGVVAVRETPIPYPVYVFVGTLLWGIVSEAIRTPLETCTQARPMLSKLNFPREALIVASVYKTLFNSGIKIGFALIAIAFLGVLPGWQFLLFPLGIASLILAGTAIGLLLTPLGLLYQDVMKGIGLIMQFLMYLTPVVYPMPEEGWAATVILLNPMTSIILNARNWLTGMAPEHIGAFIITNAILLVILFIAWIIYRAAMPMLIERMNA